MALQPKYTLYYSIRSPFGRRVRVALQKLVLTFDPREIDSFNPPADFYEANPLGLSPVLVMNEGREVVSIPDSSTILEYLDETYGGKIWPTDPANRIRVRAASALAQGLMTNTVQWFLESKRPNPSEEWSREYLENIDRTLAQINRMPWRAMPWKVSDFQFTQAGYDLIIALDYMALRLRGFDWETKYPELARFRHHHRQRQDLVPTLPPPV